MTKRASGDSITLDNYDSQSLKISQQSETGPFLIRIDHSVHDGYARNSFLSDPVIYFDDESVVNDVVGGSGKPCSPRLLHTCDDRRCSSSKKSARGRCGTWRWPWRGGQFGNSEDAEKPNKSCYDPRNWLREVEFIMLERVQRSCVDHSYVNWSCSQHVCMKPPLVVIFTVFCARQTHWTCGCTH